MNLATERALVRVPVVMTEREKECLMTLCEDQVRSLATWFRVVVRRAWQARRPPRRAPPHQQRAEPSRVKRISVYARLTETEHDQLLILSADEGVYPSIWFRRRLHAQWDEYRSRPKHLR